MLSRITSYGLNGLDGYSVSVEVNIENGMPTYETVGLPDAAVRESKERVRAAIKNSGLYFPNTSRITVNLAPADMRKEGSIYDFAIAVGISDEWLLTWLPEWFVKIFNGERVCMLLSTGISLIINFFGNKFIVFASGGKNDNNEEAKR